MSSSQFRSRKRNSTLQAVDLLNSVNHDPPSSTLPRPRRRLLNRKPFEPRSDDIFDVPRSPEKTRRNTRLRDILTSPPATARRSNRNRLQEPSLPFNFPRRGDPDHKNSRRSPALRLFSDEEASGHSANASSDEDDGELQPVPVIPFVQESLNNSKEPHLGAYEEDYVDNGLPSMNRVEEAAADDTSREANEDWPEQAEDNTNYEAREDWPENAEDDTNQEVPNANGLEWTAAHSANHELSNTHDLERPADEERDEYLSVGEPEYEDYPSEPAAPNEQRESPIDWEQDSDSNSFSEGSAIDLFADNPRKRKSSVISGSQEADPDPGPDQADRDQTMEELAEESEEAIDSDEEPASEAHARPQKQPRPSARVSRLDYIEIPTRRPSTPPFEPNNQSVDSPPQSHEMPSPSPNLGEPELGEEQSEHAASPPQDSRGPSVTTESAVEADTGDTVAAPSRTQSLHKADGKTLWKTLRKESKRLKGLANDSMEGYFEDVHTLIGELYGTYKDMRNQLADGHSIPIRAVLGCENLLRGISTEGFKILDKVWSLASKDRSNRALDLLVAVETLLIPAMVDLVGCCYRTYSVGVSEADGSFPKAYSQLHGVMALLLSFCKRVLSQIYTNVVHTKPLIKKLELALRNLMKAFESGTLSVDTAAPHRERRRRSAPFQYEEESDHSSDVEPLAPSQKAFTDEESRTLVRALQLHQGPDRYVQIIRKFGAYLPNRTISELQTEARRVRDRFVSDSRDLLSTPDGYQKLQWLLTV